MRRAALLTGLVVPVVVAAAGGGLVLAGAVPAAAATAASSCTDTWVGGAPKVLWADAENWSTDRVPGPSDNVCMSLFAIVTATGPIRINSLQVGGEMTVVFAGRRVSSRTRSKTRPATTRCPASPRSARRQR